ncbi:hypothetical protein Tco_0182104, partial [Tanacetum coccineum]
MSRCFNWNPLIERFHKRLSKWKSKTLSIGGRLTLTKSILGSLGVYYFSTFKAPKKVINQLESIRRNFFWGGSLDDNKIPWIAWKKVICSIHGPLGGLDDNSSLRPNSRPWYHIAKIKDDLLKVNINLDNIFKIKLRNGQSTSFWNNIWISDTPLVASFPRLYRLDINPDYLVCDRNPTAHVPLSSLTTTSNVTRHSIQST